MFHPGQNIARFWLYVKSSVKHVQRPPLRRGPHSGPSPAAACQVAGSPDLQRTYSRLADMSLGIIAMADESLMYRRTSEGHCEFASPDTMTRHRVAIPGFEEVLPVLRRCVGLERPGRFAPHRLNLIGQVDCHETREIVVPPESRECPEDCLAGSSAG